MADILDPLGIYDAADVARLVHGKSLSWFYKHCATLRRLHGFPAPISPVGHPRWNGAALIAWKERGTAPLPAAGSNVVDYSARLAARADALARTAGGRRKGSP